jgi:hypothetical protein
MEQTMSAAAGWSGSIRDALDHPLQRLRMGYAAWLFGVFCYFLPAATWNPVSRFDLTRAIVEQRTLSIDAYADNTGDRARRAEHWYTDKAPISSLLALPAYQAFHWLDLARGKSPSYQAYASEGHPAQRVTVNRSFQRSLYVCSLATSGLAGVAIGLGLFELLRRRMSPTAALAGSAATVLATPIFPYATSFYGHVVAGAFLVVALALLDGSAAFEGGGGHGPAEHSGPRRFWIGAAGACLGASVGSEYLSAVPAAVLLAAFLGAALRASYRVRGAQASLRWCLSEAVVPLALGALGPVLLIAGYHWACFGAPWRTGYSFVVDPTFAAGHATGFLGIRVPRAEALWGLSFGRLRGLFYISPLALALTVGLVVRAKRDWAAATAALASLALLLVNASYYMWWGGAASAPRHLVPVLGLLGLGAPWLWQRRGLRYVCLGLGLVALINMLGIAAVGLEAPEHGDVLLDFVYARLLDGKVSALSGASNLGIEFGLVRGGTLGPLFVWLLVGAHVLYRQVGEVPPAPAVGAGAVPSRA